MISSRSIPITMQTNQKTYWPRFAHVFDRSKSNNKRDCCQSATLRWTHVPLYFFRSGNHVFSSCCLLPQLTRKARRYSTDKNCWFVVWIWPMNLRQVGFWRCQQIRNKNDYRNHTCGIGTFLQNCENLYRNHPVIGCSQLFFECFPSKDVPTWNGQPFFLLSICLRCVS